MSHDDTPLFISHCEMNTDANWPLVIQGGSGGPPVIACPREYEIDVSSPASGSTAFQLDG